MNANPTRLTPLFSPGRIVATQGAAAAASEGLLAACLVRHLHGDWGCCAEDDKAANDAAVGDGERILSAYPLDPAKPCKGYGSNTLWIITEADRSVTTLLLPDEY
jgi:hypothetical protein